MDWNTFVVANPHKCIGCRACEIACAIAHLETSVVAASAMNTPFLPRLNLVQTPLITMPIQCRQCDDAPCANICPVSAITHQDDKIAVNTKKCIGCKSCMIACPFGAVDLVPEYKNGQIVEQNSLQLKNGENGHNKDKLIAHKCDICTGRKEGPACLEACPASAFVVVKPDELKKSIKSRRTAAALEVSYMKRT